MISGSDVLIVIPCLNEERMLPQLLAWLQATNAEACVVVADGGSSDSSRAIVTSAMSTWLNLHLLDNPQRIQSSGVNLAVERFGEGRRWLVRIDAHAQYPHDYISILVDSAMRRNAESVVVPMVTMSNACFQMAIAAAQNSVLGTGGSPHRHIGEGRFVDHGHHALMRLDSFRGVGGYDPTFSHNEDAEFDVRLRAAGYRIWLEPSAAVQYYPRTNAKALWLQYFRFGKGRARTILKHRITPKPRQALPLFIAPLVLAALLALPASFFWRPAILLATPALAWACISLTAGLLLALRKRSKCTLGAGIAMMIMHAAWSCGFWSQIVSAPQKDR